MKKIIFFFAVIAAYTGVVQTANAHAIWIESNPAATKNKAHEVKIFYGEYPEGEVEPTAKWYSDLKSLEVWLTSPSKKKTRLVLTDATDHLNSSFVPDEEGVYFITTVHATKDLGGATKYEFSSVAPVLSGKTASLPAAPEIPLAIIVAPKTYRADGVVELQVRKGSEAFVGGEVMIMSPEGWVKTVKTNDKGQVSFTPKLKGSYVIEASEYKKETGEWNQKQYTHTWKGSTTRILVN